MSSSDCTSSTCSSPSSSHNKSGAPPTPPPPILGSILSDQEDNDAMSDQYPDHDTSEGPTTVMNRHSMAPCNTMEVQHLNLRPDDQAANNLLPDSSDALTSEGVSLANKEDVSPVAGRSSARGGAVAAKRGLRSIDPKSKKIMKSRLVPVRKSQLTPRMALYIPPHLQKQTQHVSPAPKTVSSPTIALTPQQKHREEEIHDQMKLVARNYQLKQYHGISRRLARMTDPIVSLESKKIKPNRKPLPVKLWTTEMENLILNRNTSHEKFVEMGEEDLLKESKLAKKQLRKLLRKARSDSSTVKNPYKILEKAHEEYMKSDVFKKFKSSTKTFEERKSRTSNEPGGSTSFEISHDISDHLEEEYDSSFYLSLSQRHEARMEWSEAILEFNSSPASRLRSPPEIVKVEIIDSDEDSPVQNESPTRVKSSSAPEKNSKRYGKFDSAGRPQKPTTPRSSKQSANSSTTQGSMDVSNNEYLNQQFLRRQHDYEREQKFHQIELASESNEFLRGSTENLFRGRDPMDDALRLHPPPLAPFPPMFGAASPLRFPPVFPIRNIYSGVRPLPEREPEEPFVGDRRRRPPHPALVPPMVLDGSQPPSLKEHHLLDLHGRNHTKLRRVRSSSPGSSYPIKEVNGSHPLEVGRNVTLFRSSRESSPVVRNYSNERIATREYPVQRPLSPFSERIMRAAGKDSRRSNHDGRARDREDSFRQLSPFSERMQNRERRLSPFSERMRSRENIDRHNSPPPGRENNLMYPQRKSTSHHVAHEFYPDHPADDRAKLTSSRRVRSRDRHRSSIDTTFGSRDQTKQRGSGSDRDQRTRSRRETANDVPQSARFALHNTQNDTGRKSSRRRRSSESHSRMTGGSLSNRNHDTSSQSKTRKHSEIRKRTRHGSSSRAPPSLGKRQRR